MHALHILPFLFFVSLSLQLCWPCIQPERASEQGRSGQKVRLAPLRQTHLMASKEGDNYSTPAAAAAAALSLPDPLIK